MLRQDESPQLCLKEITTRQMPRVQAQGSCPYAARDQEVRVKRNLRQALVKYGP